MATKKKDPKDILPSGRPTEFKLEYCDLLLEHMKGGNTFESFGGIAKCSKTTLYNWLEAHPKFVNARKIGEPLLERFMVDMGKMIATGQLRRLKSETPILNDKKEPVYDRNGNVLMHREYEHVTGSAAAWIFLTKNMLKWRDRQDINVGGQPDNQTPITVRFSHLTKDEVEKQYNQLMREALANERKKKGK